MASYVLDLKTSATRSHLNKHADTYTTLEDMSPEPLYALLIHTNRHTDRHVENNSSFRYRGC